MRSRSSLLGVCAELTTPIISASVVCKVILTAEEVVLYGKLTDYLSASFVTMWVLVRRSYSLSVVVYLTGLEN